LRPTPEFQERLDAHTAAKAERSTAVPQDSTGARRPPDATRSQDAAPAQRPLETRSPPDVSTAAAVGDRNATVPAGGGDRNAPVPAGDGDSNATAPAGEQADEHAANRRFSEAERAKATGDTGMPGEAARPQPVQDLAPQPNPLPEADPSPLDNRQALPPSAQPAEVPLPTSAEQSSGQSPDAEGENTPHMPVVEQVAQHEPDADPPGPEDATPTRDGAGRPDDAKVPTEIADEIALSPVDIRTKPHVNSAGETVDRYIIDDAEDLLPVAEHFGIDELSHDKDDYYSGQLPDGRYRKIEWNMKGHPNTNEGPHVKVMETEDPAAPPSRGNRWKTKAMIFVEGHEQFKKQWH
jgi:hypothetical protein